MVYFPRFDLKMQFICDIYQLYIYPIRIKNLSEVDRACIISL